MTSTAAIDCQSGSHLLFMSLSKVKVLLPACNNAPGLRRTTLVPLGAAKVHPRWAKKGAARTDGPSRAIGAAAYLKRS
jgi:hypothetical protein